jgi:RimJ/RimL family protein N-acetyltransferase
VTVLRTERTVLRDWTDDDLEPFARLNADPEVMRYFPTTLTSAESNAMATRIRESLAGDGYGLWALEVPGVSTFCGFVGLNPVRFEAHFAPALEIGWRLDRPWWGHGYASESARACLDLAFGELGLDEVVSMTTTSNLRSQAVMQRLGMTRDPADDFDHPNIAVGNPLRRHVLYRLRRDQSASHRT